MKGRNPLSSIFVPTSSVVLKSGISKATNGIFGASNQGRTDRIRIKNMSATSANLPTGNGSWYNSTQQYFNNFYVQQPVP
jgi:hypothetical protein